MALNINILSAIDWTSGLGRKFRRREGEASTIRETIIVQSNAQFENLVGRFDLSDRVRSRVLDVPSEDTQLAAECGAVWNEEKNAFLVPEGMSEDDFQEWWPKVPEDLRDSQSRITITKDGRRAEGFLQGNDMGQGNDSIATPLMYLAFPAIGALTLFLVSWIGWAGWAFLLTTIPYFIALKQGESMKEALKALVLLQWIPMGMAGMSKFSALGVGGAAAGSAGLQAYMAFFTKAAVIGFGLVGVIFVVCLVAAASHPHRGVIGGTAARFIQAMKWVGIILGALLVAKVLPWGLGDAVPFVLACMYAMQFTEGNFVQTGARLCLQNNDNNLGTQGALVNSHVKAREQQAQNALNDTTPLITIGRATGHLSDKGYGYSPDKGTIMRLSLRDLTQGLIVFGMPGTGKSYSILRPIARRYRRAVEAIARKAGKKGMAGGALIADGKDGAIISDLEDLFDIVVKPGLAVGPYEGLEPDQIVKALRGASGGVVDEKSKLWSDGGDAFIYHTGIILKALVEHEKTYRAWCMAKLDGLEESQLLLKLEERKLRKLGQNTTEVEERLAEVVQEMGLYSCVVDSDRGWAYTPLHHAKLLSNVERVIPTGTIPKPNPKIMEVIKYLGLEEPDNSLDEEGRATHAAYLNAYRKRQQNEPQTIHPDLKRPMSQLQSSLEWALLEVPAMNAEQRQSFTLNSRGLLEKLLRGEKLRDANDIPWHSIEKGEVDVSKALYGEMVGLFLPPTQYGDAGEMMMRLLKQRVMNGIKARGAHGDKWRQALPGQVEVMLMMDEAHLLLTADDTDMFSISRSLGLMPVLATQGFESLEDAFGSRTKAELLANLMQSVGALRCSFNTVEYLIKRFGQAMLTTFKQKTRGIDYKGGLENYRHSVLNDPNHPHAAVFDKMRLEGAGRLTALRVDPATGRRWRIGAEDVIGQDELARDIDMPTGGKREVQPLFGPEEYQALLEPRGHAIVALNRAGHKRIDLAELVPDLD
ncbi:TraM recognition domain-containing protein [Stenotrophomonas sepilia]|uniref:TraM recognition domain-containing protein n=1 Tax=Stenotrophomonas sepilia TaxID=2860290 RepID=UPI002E77A134|nr:TraM recognition domain-containing protein [Stenotrophomonas sepilia]